MKNDPLDFWKKYELVNSTKNWFSEPVKSMICRYCGKNSNETTFEEDTHLIPELLGENNFLTFDECDSCNHLFSKYESHLAIFAQPYLTLLGVKGKRKTPTFQSRTINRDEDTRTMLSHKDQNLKELKIRDIDDYKIDIKVEIPEALTM